MKCIPLVDPGAFRRLRAAFHGPLVRWFRLHRRDLPWRAKRTPYRVWISELMLQQTRVETVIPYFVRFLKRFPSVEALAVAPRQDVLKMWEGLGYYSRARHAQDAARLLVRENDGRFPSTMEGWLALPGVGRYTAAAVGSLALGFNAAVVDGNVERVLSRVLAFRHDVRTASARRAFQDCAEALLIPGRAGLSNESLMELGALVCTPKKPECPACPLRRVCSARAEGVPEQYPGKKRKAKVPHKIVGAGVVVRGDGRVLIAQRKESSMLGGLWEFPGGTLERGESLPECIRRELNEELGIDTAVGPLLAVVRHAYSHFTIELHTHWARIVKGRPRAIHCADFAWRRPRELRSHPFSTADLQIVQRLENWSGVFPMMGRTHRRAQ